MIANRRPRINLSEPLIAALLDSDCQSGRALKSVYKGPTRLSGHQLNGSSSMYLTSNMPAKKIAAASKEAPAAVKDDPASSETEKKRKGRAPGAKHKKKRK